MSFENESEPNSVLRESKERREVDEYTCMQVGVKENKRLFVRRDDIDECMMGREKNDRNPP